VIGRGLPCRRKHSGKKPLAGQTPDNIPGETIGALKSSGAPRTQGVMPAAPRRLEVTPLVRVLTGAWTWRATSGSGARMRPDRYPARTARCGAARGTTTAPTAPGVRTRAASVSTLTSTPMGSAAWFLRTNELRGYRPVRLPEVRPPRGHRNANGSAGVLPDERQRFLRVTLTASPNCDDSLSEVRSVHENVRTSIRTN
jgi:hypothetical protein